MEPHNPAKQDCIASLYHLTVPARMQPLSSQTFYATTRCLESAGKFIPKIDRISVLKNMTSNDIAKRTHIP